MGAPVFIDRPPKFAITDGNLHVAAGEIDIWISLRLARSAIGDAQAVIAEHDAKVALAKLTAVVPIRRVRKRDH